MHGILWNLSSPWTRATRRVARNAHERVESEVTHETRVRVTQREKTWRHATTPFQSFSYFVDTLRLSAAPRNATNKRTALVRLRSPRKSHIQTGARKFGRNFATRSLRMVLQPLQDIHIYPTQEKYAKKFSNLFKTICHMCVKCFTENSSVTFSKFVAALIQQKRESIPLYLVYK